MSMVESEKELVENMIRSWKRKRSVIYALVGGIGGIFPGLMIGYFAVEPLNSFVVSVFAILITVQIAFITLATSWITTRWGVIANVIMEKDFNDIRRVLRHIIEVIDPEGYKLVKEYTDRSNIDK